jgi:hypothetical protein
MIQKKKKIIISLYYKINEETKYNSFFKYQTYQWHHCQ